MNYDMGLYRELEFKSVSEGMNINPPSWIHMTHIGTIDVFGSCCRNISNVETI